LKGDLAALRDVVDERDRLYKERDESRKTAVDAALQAAKEKTADAFLASEKAIVKAEDAQKLYDQGHNDLLRKMDDQYRHMLPREEADAKFKSIEDKLEVMRTERHSQSQWNWQQVVAVGGIVVVAAIELHARGVI
jgi:hypothetical protein